MNKEIILCEFYGGLGDNLQFSTLPEEYTKRGYDVYIHPRSVCSNKEIYDLVWGMNPYVKGIKDGNINAGTRTWWPSNVPQLEENSFIETMELRHGLEKTNKYPKIYYEPKIRDELKNTIIIDLNSKNEANNILQNIGKYKEEIAKIVNNESKIAVLNYTKIGFNNATFFDEYDVINIDNIYELCDVIASCSKYVCGFSGTACLASAIKKDNIEPNIHCLCYNRVQEHWCIFGFPNIDYINVKP